VSAPDTYKGFCRSENGCISEEVSITVTQAPNCDTQTFFKITPAKPVICPGTSVQLVASGCTGRVSWIGGGTGQAGSSASILIVSPTSATTYVAQCSTGGIATADVGVAATDVTVTKNISSGENKFKALNAIESSKKIGDPNFSLSANVSFEAGNSITLQPGFVAEKNSIFRAEIKGCN
jgi:hypothetical protein